MQSKEGELCSSTDLWGPEPAGGAGPAYVVMVVAPWKLSLLSGRKALFDVPS